MTLKQVTRFIAVQSDEDNLALHLMTITYAVAKAIVAVYVCGVIAGEFLTAVYVSTRDAVVRPYVPQVWEEGLLSLSTTGFSASKSPADG